MKKDFVRSWKSSKQPRKQRKYRYNAPLHKMGKFVTINLSKELRKKYEKRNLRARKGDKVKILRGHFKGKSGSIDRVSLKYSKIYVNGIEMSRKDGTKILIPIEPSNTQLIDIDSSDKKRIKGKGA
jgi:large subunit ribosomal protein L24